jgi:membrane-bound serine protease (ClpP class)
MSLSQAVLRRIALRPFFLLALLLALLSTTAVLAAQGRGPIYSVTIEGPLSRFSVDYLERALRQAEAAQADALLIRLAPQGAVLRDVERFAERVAEARVPVIVYVGPAGVASGAAGAWLLSAAHLAAMAPDTQFGAIQPLAVPDASLTDATRELFFAETAARLSEWNVARGRSDAWVERAVREGAILTNEQASALEPPAIDVVVRSQAELLTVLEGRVVDLADGTQVTLRTLGRDTSPIDPTPIEQFLLLLADPTIVFLLLVMAGIAVYAELVTPTVGILAGVGVVLFIAALVGIFALPVNWLAVVALLFAFGLIAADLYLAAHGSLTVVGLVVLVLSALNLYDNAQAPGVFVALWAIVMVAIMIGAFAAIGIWLVMRTRRQPVATGQEGLVGQLAEVRVRLDPEGMVFVEGALWRAVSEDGDIEAGEWVRVTGVYELRLTVARLADDRLATQRAGSSL